jgi:hypothetical protein
MDARERGDSLPTNFHRRFSIVDFGFSIGSKVGNPKSEIGVDWWWLRTPLLPRNCKSYESRSIGHCSS